MLTRLASRLQRSPCLTLLSAKIIVIDHYAQKHIELEKVGPTKVAVTVADPDDLSSTLRTHMLEGENCLPASCPLTSAFTPWHVYVHVRMQINICNLIYL